MRHKNTVAKIPQNIIIPKDTHGGLNNEKTANRNTDIHRYKK